MGELISLFSRYSRLIEEAFDLDENGDLIEKDSSKVYEADLLFHDLFVSNMGDILTELAPYGAGEEDTSGHTYSSPFDDDSEEFGRGWRGPYGGMTPVPRARGTNPDQDNEFSRGRVSAPQAPQAPQVAGRPNPHADVAPMIRPQDAMAAMTGQGFAQKAPGIMTNLMHDFSLTPQQAAGIVGNLGHETGGFSQMQELRPTSGRGGLGWGQWTGPRRVDFENWAKQNNLDTNSDEANYGFLKHELQTTYAPALNAVRQQNSVDGSMRAFEGGFERAGVKNYADRNIYGNQALQIYQRSQQQQQPDNGLSQYAHGNAVPGGASSVEGVNSEFGRRIQAMVQAMPPDLQQKFSIESGFRDADRERQVYQSQHQGQAIPTDSYHSHGLAVDINRDPDVQNWIHQNGNQYGVGFTLSGTPGEDNHLEPTMPNGQRIPHGQIDNWIAQNQPKPQQPQQQTAQAGGTPGQNGQPQNYLAIGDSLGLGVGRVLGNAQYTHGGWNPQAVNGLVDQAIKDGKVQGQHIILSGGASNAGGNTNLVSTYYPQMIDSLKKAGAADVTVMGVGPYSHFDKYGYNNMIGDITKQSGTNFTGPLANVTRFSGTDLAGGVHPNDYRPIISYVQNQFQPKPDLAQNEPPKPLPVQQANASLRPGQQPPQPQSQPQPVPDEQNNAKIAAMQAASAAQSPTTPTAPQAQAAPAQPQPQAPPAQAQVQPQPDEKTPQTSSAYPRLRGSQVKLAENRRRPMIGLLRPYK